MWALGSQDQLLGYISLMLVMETVSIAQIELNSHLLPALREAKTPAWQEHHTEILNSCGNLGLGGARGDFLCSSSLASLALGQYFASMAPLSSCLV